MLTNYLVIDLATAPIPDAATYLEGTIRAPSNYKDPDKIAAYISEKKIERATMAAVDVDLARITAVGICEGDVVEVYDAMSETHERKLLVMLAQKIFGRILVTFGGLNFDLPLLMRRARYLDVEFPQLQLDTYRGEHVDLCELLADRNPQRRRPLGFYVKRLGWTDLHKPLSGADEARVFETGKWDELRESVYHDVAAVRRLAGWLGLVAPIVVDEPAA